MGLANLGSESETCVGSRVPLVGVSISFEKNFYWLPFTPPPLWFAASVLQNGLFCELLEELLQDIEHSVRPLYITRHYVEPGMRDYYTTEVHV
jgi:hypothetical protein